MMERRPDNLTWWHIAGFAILLLSALVLRVQGLTAESLTADEVVIAQHAQGILTSGYPQRTIGHISYRLFNYELVPFPVALNLLLGGVHEGTIRLASLVFGLLTICLLFWVGLRLFDRTTAFLAALIYAFSPWTITWSQNLFHPSQDQFFSLLTIYLFYRGAIEDEEIRPAYLYGAAASFTCTYLSWEGTGLILPSFLVALFWFRRHDFSWMKSGPLWLTALVAVAVAALELCWRLTAVAPYLLSGLDLVPPKDPTLAFLEPQYDFWVFWRSFLWAENHALLTLVAVLGLPLAWRNRALAYCYLIGITLTLSLRLFLSHLVTHYFFFIFPLLLLTAAYTLSFYLTRCYEFLAASGGVLAKVFKGALGLAACGLVFFSTNPLLFTLYRLTYPSQDELHNSRLNQAWVDYRGGDRFLSRKAEAAPILYNMGANLALFENIQVNYAFYRKPEIPEIYDYLSPTPYNIEKFGGAQVLRYFRELDEFFHQHRQSYIVVSNLLRSQRTDPDLLKYLDAHCKPVYYSYDLKIYSWHR